MQLKTYRAGTMADALAEVKKDLGSKAVILHTRTYKQGGVLGLGAKPIVEITASDTARPLTKREREDAKRKPTTASQSPESRAASSSAASFTPSTPPTPPAPSTHPAQARSTVRPLDLPDFTPIFASEPTPTPTTTILPSNNINPPPRKQPESSPKQPPQQQPKPAPIQRLTSNANFAPANNQAKADLENELASIKRMVSQVLRCSQHASADATTTSVSALPEPLFDLYVNLIDHEVQPEIAGELGCDVRASLTPEELTDPQTVRQALLRAIERRIPVAPLPADPKTKRVIALLGPTGVGKTTTVAKLAANLKLRQGRTVGLITSDTYRIAAVEQLRTYANIIGLPLKVTLTPQEMRAAVEQMSDCDVILIDTAGRSQNDQTKLDELLDFIDAASPSERHLVLAANVSHTVMAAAADRFGALSPDSLILSKLDESVHYGPILNAVDRVGLPLSHVTTGQEVPDHIERASAERLARLILDGNAQA